MKIISGKYKGKKISYIKSNTTRPLRSFVKENIFNILFHKKDIQINFKDAKILDLYSGVGSFGIECISRDANKVIFVEKDHSAFNILKKNIINLNAPCKSELKFLDVRKYIENLEQNIKFDLFFFDPPYADSSYIEIIKLIKKKKLFNKNNIVIIHREKNNEDELIKVLKISLQKNYGRSTIIFGSF